MDPVPQRQANQHPHHQPVNLRLHHQTLLQYLGRPRPVKKRMFFSTYTLITGETRNAAGNDSIHLETLENDEN